MSFRRSDGPADRAESERLLDAARAGAAPEPGADPLAYLLAAAAVPGSPDELRGEQRALAAFRAARVNPAPVPARALRRGGFRAGTVVWVAGVAATATAGVAFAAVSFDGPRRPTPPPVATTAGSAGAGTTGSPPSPTGTPRSAQTSGSSVGDGPSPTGGPGRPAGVAWFTGLCRAYLAKPVGQRPRALERAAFADLVAVAGGVGQVDAYCARLVAEPKPRVSPGVPTTRSPGAAAPTPARRAPKPRKRG